MRHLRLLFAFISVCMATYVSAARFQLAGIIYTTISGDEPAVAVIGWDNEYFLN